MREHGFRIVSFKSNFIYKARNFRPVEELCGAQKPLRAQSVFLRPKNLPFGRQVVANRRERCLIGVGLHSCRNILQNCGRQMIGEARLNHEIP